MNINHSNTRYFPEESQQFDLIFYPDGTCTLGDCCNPGVVLAYDDFFPEFGHWFCAECWPDFEDLPMLVIVEDRRP